MSRAPKAKDGGAAAILFLFCFVVAGVALALDYNLRGAGVFWIGAQPGGRAALGVGVAAFCALAGYGARALLARGGVSKARKGRNVRPDA